MLPPKFQKDREWETAMFRRWFVFVVIISLPLVGSFVLIKGIHTLCGHEFMKIGICKNFLEANHFETENSDKQAAPSASLSWERPSI
ncbi:hypothetical protein D3C76_1701080 [compost metagenome]